MAGHSKWANIKHRKGRQDALKGKVFTKVAREIMVAVKHGGADPAGNVRLKMALQKARENNLPNDNIQRAIQKGLGSGDDASYDEIVYEGYGPEGVAVMLNIMTDNRNRTAGEIRHIFSKCGGNLGETGCVGWMFERKGVLTLIKEDLKFGEDDLMLLSLEAGAEDVKSEIEMMQVITDADSFDDIKNTLEVQGLAFYQAQVTMIPKNTIEVNDTEQAKLLLKMMDLLEEHDDVQDVFANFDIAEEIMELIN